MQELYSTSNMRQNTTKFDTFRKGDNLLIFPKRPQGKSSLG